MWSVFHSGVIKKEVSKLWCLWKVFCSRLTTGGSMEAFLKEPQFCDLNQTSRIQKWFELSAEKSVKMSSAVPLMTSSSFQISVSTQVTTNLKCFFFFSIVDDSFCTQSFVVDCREPFCGICIFLH